jgi:Derlin-2/3
MFAVYYFFSDIYPRIRNGSRPLDPPQFWRRLFAGVGTTQPPMRREEDDE